MKYMSSSGGPSRVSIIIPFLNEQENLPILYKRCLAVFETLSAEPEFVFIDDGSTDASLPWVMATAAEDDRVKYIQLSRNFGHQRAITAGMNLCSGDAAVIIDAGEWFPQPDQHPGRSKTDIKYHWQSWPDQWQRQ